MAISTRPVLPPNGLPRRGGKVAEESTIPDLVERRQRLTGAANRRDLDAIMAFYAPDRVYDMSPIGKGVGFRVLIQKGRPVGRRRHPTQIG
jgi:hypothetical protein